MRRSKASAAATASSAGQFACRSEITRIRMTASPFGRHGPKGPMRLAAEEPGSPGQRLVRASHRRAIGVREWPWVLMVVLLEERVQVRRQGMRDAEPVGTAVGAPELAILHEAEHDVEVARLGLDPLTPRSKRLLATRSMSS